MPTCLTRRKWARGWMSLGAADTRRHEAETKKVSSGEMLTYMVLGNSGVKIDLPFVGLQLFILGLDIVIISYSFCAAQFEISISGRESGV